MKTQPVRLFLCTAFVGVVLILLVMPQSGVASSQIQTGFTDSNVAQQKNTCQAILTQAIETLNTTCDKLDRNNACYGNNAVEAELSSTTIKFNASGDRAPIRMIKRLVTSPLDTEKGTWGLSLLKLQANLPDTMPGQNVLFLVYGNTTIENTSGNMQAFYFTSGLGSPACKEAPRDGILVRSPNHTEVTFSANGVQVTIASTVILRAERNKTMDVLLVEGHARITTPQGSQTLQPGQTVSVPLGGSTGLEPVSPPSAPVTVDPDSTLPIILVSTEKFSPAHAPINVSVEGCITKTQGNTVTIQGQEIQYQPNDVVLRGAKVGDCVRVNGSLQGDNQGKSVIIAVPNTATPPTVKPNAVQPSNNSSNPGNPVKSNPVNNAGGNGSNNSNNNNGGGNSGGNSNPVSSAGGGNGGNPSSNGSNPDPVVHTPTPTYIPDHVPSGNGGTGTAGTAAPTTSTTNPGNAGGISSPTAVGEHGGNPTNYTPVPEKDRTPSTPGKGKDGNGNNNGNDNSGGNENGNNNGQNNNDQGNGPSPAGPTVPPNNPSSPGTTNNNVPPSNPAPANNPVSSNPVEAVSTP